ncbi:MAG: hypothetical protein N2596_09255 [Syntrophorhabdaceae bacterium]|nr:hypothetical protein [Syntrophorhabdaceae bacterium]
MKVQVLEIGEGGWPIRVRNKDEIILQYTHSMFGVPVIEKFFVEDGSLILYHVDTNYAALEYFGIEGKKKDNIKLIIKEFSIPKDSIGKHTLYVKDKVFMISQFRDFHGSVRIRLRRIPLIMFFKYCLWR